MHSDKHAFKFLYCIDLIKRWRLNEKLADLSGRSLAIRTALATSNEHDTQDGIAASPSRVCVCASQKDTNHKDVTNLWMKSNQIKIYANRKGLASPMLIANQFSTIHSSCLRVLLDFNFICFSIRLFIRKLCAHRDLCVCLVSAGAKNYCWHSQWRQGVNWGEHEGADGIRS